jgi:prephenate dehydratase
VKFFRSGFELVPGCTASEVIRCYKEGKAEQAILAIDSSIGGTVGANLDEIAKLDAVRIIGETILAVNHQLVARHEVSILGIKAVLAHPKALEECEVWLAQNLPDTVRITVSSSAAAAKKASDDPSGETAAIASETAADLYRMKILAAHIESSPLNTTRFWIFGRDIPSATEYDKTTLLVTGDLNAVLSLLVNAKIKILSIYERPSGGKIGASFYFLDIEGHCQKPPLSHIFHHFPEGRWLGSYPRT